MKSTVYHYYGPKKKGKCCQQFTEKNWALISAIYTLVSLVKCVTSTKMKMSTAESSKACVNILRRGIC